MTFSVNHPIIFILVGLILSAVLAQSLYFLIKAYRRAVAIGMDTSLLKKTIISSAIFTIAPAVSILIGVISLSKSLGVAVPWLRLSVIGSLSYEMIAAQNAIGPFEKEGFSLAEEILSAEVFVTIIWVMTIGIALGLVLTPLLTKKIQNGMIKLEKSDKKWREIFNNAMFIGMISAFLGFVFCDFSNLFKGDTSALIAPFTMFTSAIIMAVLGVLAIKTKKRWLTDYALPISMVAGMVMAIPYTAWLG